MCSRCVGAHQDVLEHIWSTYGAHIANGIRAPCVLVHISMCTICAPDMHQMCSSTFRCVPDALVHIRMCWSTYGAHMVHILQTVYVHHMCSCTSVCACAHLYVHHMCTRCAPDVLEHI